MGNRYSLNERIKRKITRDAKRLWYYYIRKNAILYAKSLGVKVGSNCQILDDSEKIFGSEPWLIKLGNHVRITKGVEFLTHEGAVWCAREIDKYKKSSTYETIVVGDNVMIGVHSLIMPGVKIGNNVIIGSHCVVTKDIEDGMIVGGVPARVISTTEQFINKLESRELFDILDMTQEQKRKYLLNVHSEWFE